ncbi:MAG TPA: DUF1553 domain-containing protein [Planctomycetota bacterium]|nr:DUF1553 domain-containing protein [Planctomycetota bacterium]
MPNARALSVALATILVFVLCLAARPASGSEAETLFRQQVLPVLQQNCFKCHGPQARRLRGGLRMNGLDSLLKGGDGGPAIVPGDPDNSPLVKAVRRTDPDFMMPPDDPLPPEATAAIEQWVRLGAAWPDDLVEGSTPAAPGAEPASAAPPDAAPAPTDHDALQFFEERVRPLLADSCFKCHGPALDKVKGGLRMSGREALLRGGSRGPALVPGQPEESRLVEAVSWTDADLSMPPDDKLSAEQIATLTSWVAMGAPWPADESAPPAAEHAESTGPDIAAGRTWWAFKPVVRPEPPAVDASRVANPIDAFVLAKLDAAGLKPNPRADRATLARRAWFDLLGLPPSAADVQAFVDDDAPDAWPRLIDTLLARPEYGERWGRYWLDVVRWAQTNGYERDTEKPYAWRYRDWVIDAFNRDLPYDRFVLEQLAGDELPDATDESLVATGFYRIGVWDDEPDDTEQAKFDELDDTVRTVAEGFMGVTLGCARCHDHKFDPFAQTDYYSTLAFLRNIRPYTAPHFALDSETLRPLGAQRDDLHRWGLARQARIDADNQEIRRLRGLGRLRAAEARRAALTAEQSAALEIPADQRSPEQAALVAQISVGAPTPEENQAALTVDERRSLAKLELEVEDIPKSFEGDLHWGLMVRESRGPAPETHVLVRGRASAPAELVEPRFVQVLCASDGDAAPRLPEPSEASRSTGRRLALARWIASPQQPTTARVMVNRIWQHHFGRGLVATPNDFGHQGTPPTHPELLDWLASEFTDGGWGIKDMHRLIMTSNTYCSSSSAADAAALERDPDNTLLWRQDLRRLEAEAVRDTVLSVAGTLSDERGGRGFFPRLSREALAGGSRPGQGWELPDGREPRSIYCYVKRSLLPPFLEVFDYNNTSLPVGSRQVTTMASQALILLNSEFMGEQAAAFATRVRAEAGDDVAAQITQAFELALARPPSEAERTVARGLYDRELAEFAAAPHDLVFKARIASRADAGFLPKLDGTDVLFGPRAGWTYLKGRWGNGYNSTLEMDPAAGPAALLDAPVFRDGSASARVLLSGGCEMCAFLLRATAAGDGYDGVEAVLDPRAGKLRLVAHAGDTETVLAETDADLAPGTWHTLRIEARGPRLAVWLDGADGEAGRGAPRLEASLPGEVAAGQFGVRAWGDELQLSGLQLDADGQIVALQPDDPGTPEQRALRSLCLLLFNLDEFLYVD